MITTGSLAAPMAGRAAILHFQSVYAPVCVRNSFFSGLIKNRHVIHRPIMIGHMNYH
jgi:hypothetical protein